MKSSNMRLQTRGQTLPDMLDAGMGCLSPGTCLIKQKQHMEALKDCCVEGAQALVCL